jgi:tetratricopeptide (TPR) repeat protein
MFLMISRGQALREQGYKEAARKVFAEVLAAATPEPDLHNLARIERGRLHLMEGNHDKAREDFETVLADDSTFPGLTELLQQSA